MKKAFAVASISVWTLGLIIGLGLGVAAQVDATNRLPLENRILRQEVLSTQQEVSSIKIEQQNLLETLAMERHRQKELARALSMAYTRLLPTPQTAYSTSLGPRPQQD